MRGGSTKKKNTASQKVAAFVCFFLFLYFSYHLIHGDRGYFALKGLERKTTEAQAKYQNIVAERQALEHRVTILRSGSLDMDLLEERARVVLGYVRPNDRVVIHRN